jgi:hypothetical protein
MPATLTRPRVVVLTGDEERAYQAVYWGRPADPEAVERLELLGLVLPAVERGVSLPGKQ